MLAQLLKEGDEIASFGSVLQGALHRALDHRSVCDRVGEGKPNF